VEGIFYRIVERGELLDHPCLVDTHHFAAHSQWYMEAIYTVYNDVWDGAMEELRGTRWQWVLVAPMPPLRGDTVRR